MDEPKYPDVTVQLSDQDGNAMSVIASVRRGLRRAGVPMVEMADFTTTAMSGDYDNVLRTAMAWVNVE